MRRADKEVVGIAGILAILDTCEVIRIGLCADGKPYIVPMHFAYETSGEEVRIETEKTRALDILMKRYGFSGRPHYDTESLATVTVLQIHVTSITGKRKIATY